MNAWVRNEINDDMLSELLSRVGRGGRKGGGGGGGGSIVQSPTINPKMLSAAASSPSSGQPALDDKYLTSAVINDARDDGTHAPEVAKLGVMSYMNNPEWKALDAEEKQVTKSMSGAGAFWNWATAGRHYDSVATRLNILRTQKNDIEKRAWESAAIEASRRAQAEAENQKFADDMIRPLVEGAKTMREGQLHEATLKKMSADAEQSLAAAEASRALAKERGGKPQYVETSPGASLFDPASKKFVATAPLTPSQRDTGSGPRSGQPANGKFDTWEEVYDWATKRANEHFAGQTDVWKMQHQNWQKEDVPIVVNKLITEIGWDPTSKTKFETRSGGSTAPVVAKPSQAGPPVGTMRNGYRFLGGDPKDPNRWEKIGGN